MKKYKFPITVTITEEDRQKAEPFNSIHNCLIATACKRVLRDVQLLSVGTYDVSFIHNGKYESHNFSERLGLELITERSSQCAPFYTKDVVGKSFQILK
jgi:hypothetical protein